MIVFENRKLLIVTPPKCGSTALHQCLCKSRLNGIWCVGESPVDGGGFHVDKHNARVPFAWKSFRRVLVVRDPMTRLRSLWSWDHQHRHNRGIPKRSDVEFAKHVSAGSDPFQLPVSVRYAETLRSSGVEIWKLEQMQFHFHREGFDVRFKRVNQSRFVEQMSDECFDICREWIEKDSEAFEY